MIKKVIDIEHRGEASDSVELGWFDMQKPNLSAVSHDGVPFMMKVKFTHLHEGDVLVCEDGHRIGVKRSTDTVYECRFTEPLDFAAAAYEIGNRHQPVRIEAYTLTVLDDVALADVLGTLQKNDRVTVTRTQGYFIPNGKAHHAH